MSSNTDSNDIRELFSQLVLALSERFLKDDDFRFSMYAGVDATLAQAGKNDLDDWIQDPKPIDASALEEPIAGSDNVRKSFARLVLALSSRYSSDADFRSRVDANVTEALAQEGKGVLDDWIQKTKSVDPRAIEDGIRKGELNPSC